MKLVVRRCAIWSVFNNETDEQMTYDCARRMEAVDELKRMKKQIKEGKIPTDGTHDIPLR